MASITLSRLCAGSPMPMNTTLRTGCASDGASTTCATISALPRWRCRPSRPVMQNTQPTAQPTCVETHSPCGGSSTLSTGLFVRQRDQQARRAVAAGVLGVHAGEGVEFPGHGGQRGAQRQR